MSESPVPSTQAPRIARAHGSPSAARPSGGRANDPSPGAAPLPLLLAILAGLLLSCWPHLVSWMQGQGAMWVASHDEYNFYLRFTSPTYHFGGWRLGDPLLPGGGITQFPWIVFLPAVHVARSLELGPLGVLLVWRIAAGVFFPTGLYLFLRSVSGLRWGACVASVVFLTDPGAIWGRPLLRHLSTAPSVLADTSRTVEGFSLLHQWRIITPAPTFFALLLFLAALHNALRSPSRRHTLLAGLALGSLFYVYFYYWTAAGVGLALCMILQPRASSRCLAIGLIGSAIGFPQVAASWLAKQTASPDWLPRQDYFLDVGTAPGRFLVPWGHLLLLAGTLFWIRRRHPSLVGVWATAFGSFLLMNQFRVSGILIQDGHWGYACNFLLYLVVLALVLREIQPRLSPVFHQRRAFTVAAALTCGASSLALGLAYRHADATRATEGLFVRRVYQRWHQQANAGPSLNLEPRAVIAGDPEFVEPAITFTGARPLSHMAFMSASMSNQEWHERVALDGWLQGLDEAAFSAWQTKLFSGEGMEGRQGPWRYHRTLRDLALADRLQAYRNVAQTPGKFLDRFEVRYLALTPGKIPAEEVRLRWTQLQDGPCFRIWGRPDSEAGAGPTQSAVP